MLSTERGTDRPPSVSLESPSFQHCRFCQPPESICSPGASKNIDSSWKRFNTNLGTFSFSFPWWQLSWQHEAKHDCCWNGDLKKKKKRWWSHRGGSVWVWVAEMLPMPGCVMSSQEDDELIRLLAWLGSWAWAAFCVSMASGFLHMDTFASENGTAGILFSSWPLEAPPRGKLFEYMPSS